jgi:CARDB
MHTKRLALVAVLLAVLLGVGLSSSSRVSGSPGPAANPPAGKPDLRSLGGIRIGSVFIPWGGVAVLNQADAIASGAGACSFNVSYDMTNAGPAAAGSPAKPFLNRLRLLDTAAVAATSTGLALDPNQTKSLSAQPKLPVGEHRLELSLDDENAVDESNETNNRTSVSYSLRGTCGPPKPR